MPNLKTYYKFDEETGKLLSTLHLDEQEALQQGSCTQDAPTFDMYDDGFWPHRVGGMLGHWERRAIESTAPTYSEERALQYPPIKEQLDALWHAMDRGEIPKATAFYDMIASVKQGNPKPEEATAHEAQMMPEE